MVYEYKLNTPIGELLIQSNEEAVIGVYFPEATSTLPQLPATLQNEDDLLPVLKQAKNELEAYFAGELKEFNVPLHMEGTEFQMNAWQALLKIPYGETRSYQEQAEAVGSPKAFRAVGGANHANRISIIVPCHRVIGKNRKLVGFGGGLWRKEWLLEHELKHR